MPSNFTKPQRATPHLTASSSRVGTLLRITRYFTILWPVLFILAGSNTVILSTVRPPTTSPPYRSIALPLRPVEQDVQYQASLIKDNLPAYLDFVGREVLPVMSKNIDDIVHDLKGLTDIKPGLFYHAHIDYSIDVSGGIDGLMDMNHVILQYHTLENPLIYIPYWRQELGNMQDQNINAWLARIREYNKAISTPSAVSGVQYTPLTKDEAATIAASWDDYRRQNGRVSPGIEMLINMVYLIEGGKQPLYQSAFKTIYKFHSIAFSREEYLQLDNRTHLENTFSPFQIIFERIAESQALLPVFEEASAAKFGYILNLNDVYTAQPAWLHGSAGPEMVRLNLRLTDAISTLADDNLIKISTIPENPPIAFFAVGNYIFVVSGSLDLPSIFR